MEAAILIPKKTEIDWHALNYPFFGACKQQMGIHPIYETFTLYREPGPILRPLGMTRLVQQSFFERKNNYVAFKIIPEHMIYEDTLNTLDMERKWGAQVMYTGGILGSFIVQDLANQTEPDNIKYTKWDMPGIERGQRFDLFSVMVRSNDSTGFSPDMLMEMHAPDLAVETRGAHVYHFYEKTSALMFQYLLTQRIHEFAHAEEARAVS